MAYERKQWTPAKLNSVIKGAFRSASRFYPPKLDALDEAFVDVRVNKASGRMAKHRRCAHCKELFPDKMLQVNHKESVVPLSGFTSWDEVADRLFCHKDGLEVLCKPCHKIETQRERDMRKEFKKKEEEHTYSSWLSMKGRCLNPNSQRYYTHGGRGISVCAEWEKDYDKFLADMGLKPEGYSLERIDNDLGYFKENCKWATPKEQAHNRRTNVWITHDGDCLTVSQWAEAMGITHSALTKRLSKMTVEQALTKEVDTNMQRFKNNT